MKKLLAMVLCFALLLPPALAADYTIDDFTIDFNLYAVLTGAEKLPEKGYSKEGPRYVWYSESNDIVGYTENENGIIRTGFCICYDESRIGSFLSNAAAMAFTFCPADDVALIYLHLLDLYFTAKTGAETEHATISDHALISLYRHDNGAFFFIITKIG